VLYFIADNKKYGSKARPNCDNGFWTDFIHQWKIEEKLLLKQDGKAAHLK
jgi:hypothetical protein